MYPADIDIDLLAKTTAGCTGADLENIVNQAALRAAIDHCDEVTMAHLDGAKDKVAHGKRRRCFMKNLNWEISELFSNFMHEI